MRKNTYQRVKCSCGWEGKETEIVIKEVKGGGQKDVCPKCENEKASFTAVKELKVIKKKKIYRKRK